MSDQDIIEALWFYAEPATYEVGRSPSGWWSIESSHILRDGGERAREVLNMAGLLQERLEREKENA